MSDNIIPRAKLCRSHDSVVDILKQQNPQTCMGFARTAFTSGKTRPIEYRRQQLLHLKQFLNENEEKMLEVLDKDLKKPSQEAHVHELILIKNDVQNVLMNLKNWTKPESVYKKLIFFFDKAEIINDPLGVVLIIGAWNYPLQSSLLPLAGCIAAGNSFILKPSPLTPHTTSFLAETLPQYLDHESYQIYLGPINEILVERFDYVFYTGGPDQGAVISKAVAVNKTPATLIMGGMNPVYLDDTANIELAARRIMWGKCVNAGQTCIAPEYILCTKAVEEKFLKAAERALLEFYKGNVRSSKDYGRIVNENHFDRLVEYINQHNVGLGGEYTKEDLFISPTILTDVQTSSPIMNEVLYGPLLKIVTVNNVLNAIKVINSKEKPLAMYIFSSNDTNVNLILESTSCGGVTVNDTLMHIVSENLPFGGVGGSGMGAYHGKKTFDTFVHKKSVFQRPESSILDKIETIRYPPYNDFKIKGLELLLLKNKGMSTKTMSYILVFLLGFIVAVLGIVIYAHFWDNCFTNSTRRFTTPSTIHETLSFE